MSRSLLGQIAVSVKPRGDGEQARRHRLRNASAARLTPGRRGALRRRSEHRCLVRSLMRSTISRSSCGGPASRCRAIIAAAADPDYLFVAHNAAFERAILRHILAPRYGWRHSARALALHDGRRPGAGVAGRSWQGRRGAGAAAAESRQVNRAADGEATAAARRRGPSRRSILVRRRQSICKRYTTIAGRTLKPSARCIGGCRRCRRPSKSCGSSINASTIAAFTPMAC